MNSWDLTSDNGKFECQSFSVPKRGFLYRIFFPCVLAIGTSEKTIFATKCLRTVLSYATIVPHFTLQTLHHNFATAGSENGIGRSPEICFPVWQKNDLGMRLGSIDVDRSNLREAIV